MFSLLHLLCMPSIALQLAFICTPSRMWNYSCGFREMLFGGNAALVIHGEEAPEILG